MFSSSSEKLSSTPPCSSPSTSSLGRRARTSFCLTPRKAKFFIVCVLLFILVQIIIATQGHLVRNEARFSNPTAYNASHISKAAFQPPENIPTRASDTIDTFANYKYRDTCNISSLDLHAPFSPLCKDRRAMLTAMSSGGRIGYDAPYMSRGCDMRWFSSEEICEILGRFEKVIIVGDSMMRHVIGSINVLLRKDLGYGAVTDWNFSAEERKNCFCNFQFNVKSCSIQGIFRTADVAKNDPNSLSCPEGTANVMIEQMIRFPIPAEELERFKDQLPARKPERPYAFIFGHGLWNDLDLQATVDWLDEILEATLMKAPWLRTPSRSKKQSKDGKNAELPAEAGAGGGIWYRLFMTPNAAGREKPDEWLVSQGNKALMTFEDSVRGEAAKREVEHLGTWNMSIQSNKFDGVHLDLKGNMVKAMMVMNWLNLLEVEDF